MHTPSGPPVADPGYGRLSNPTTAVLEERLASLEGGRGATCTSSGHAAQLLALFALMQPGDKLVASNRLYGGSITQSAVAHSKRRPAPCSLLAAMAAERPPAL